MSHSEFKTKLLSRAERLRSRLILNLDLTNIDIFDSSKTSQQSWHYNYPFKQDELYNSLFSLSKKLSTQLAAIKINYSSIEAIGYAKTKQLIANLKKEENDLVFISDRKIAEVGHTSYLEAKYAFDAGFDAVTVVPVGFEGGIEKVFEAAGPGKGVIYVPNMSHPGAGDLYGLKLESGKYLWEHLTEKAVEHNVDGIVVPATRAEELKKMLGITGGRLLTFAVGVGEQGGVPGNSVALGADFEMIGRYFWEPYAQGRKEESLERARNWRKIIWQKYQERLLS